MYGDKARWSRVLKHSTQYHWKQNIDQSELCLCTLVCLIIAYAGLQQEEVLQVPHLPEPILVDNLSPQKRRGKEEEGLVTLPISRQYLGREGSEAPTGDRHVTWLYCHTFNTQSMPTHNML